MLFYIKTGNKKSRNPAVLYISKYKSNPRVLPFNIMIRVSMHDLIKWYIQYAMVAYNQNIYTAVCIGNLPLNCIEVCKYKKISHSVIRYSKQTLFAHIYDLLICF